MQLGYIGTGTMGNPMARALIEAGHTVTVHDVRRESATNLCEMGANWAGTPRELAEASDVVFTSLPGPVEAEQVLTDPVSGILAGLQTARCRDAGLTGQRPDTQHDYDGRRRPRRIRETPAGVGSHGQRCHLRWRDCLRLHG